MNENPDAHRGQKLQRERQEVRDRLRAFELMILRAEEAEEKALAPLRMHLANLKERGRRKSRR